jgi:hypothetical protein
LAAFLSATLLPAVLLAIVLFVVHGRFSFWPN